MNDSSGKEGRPPCIGLDFGGVIVENRKRVRGEDTGLVAGQRGQVARPGVFEAVRELVSLCDGDVWIVSKAGARMQAVTMEWLEQTDFFGRTGMAPDHLRFCAERTDKEPMCRELGLTHFVDDKVHVMQILRHAVPNLFLFGEPGGEKFCPPWATFVTSWAEFAQRATRGMADG